MQVPGALFKPNLEKMKKIYLKKNSLYFGKCNFLALIFKKSSYISGNGNPKKFLTFKKIRLSSSNIKKFVIYSTKKTFLIFRETETLKTSYIWGSNFPSSKSKNNPLLKSFLHFWKIKLFNSKLKDFLYFRKNFKSLKIKNF